MHTTIERLAEPTRQRRALAVTPSPVSTPHPAVRSRWARAGRVGVLVAAAAAAGTLFWGVPARPAALPDPEVMKLVGNGRHSSADNVEYWAARVDAVPTSASFRAQLAAAQLTVAGDAGDLGGYAVGERTARAALAIDPNDESARLALSAALAGQHDFAGALTLAEQVLQDDPDSVGALLAAGDALLELGDVAGARDRFLAASAIVGGEAPVLSRFARIESLVGSLDEATELARRALVEAGDADLRHADAAFYWFQLATFEHQRGNYVTARDHVEAALSIDPEHGGSTELLGKVLVALGEYDRAAVLYESMVEGGGAADLHGALADLYERAGRVDDARRQIALGLAVAARDADRFPAERRHLIGFLVDHDPAQALRLAELDLARRQDIHAHAWHAWSLLHTGDVEAAVEAIGPALVHRTQDARLLYQAGAIHAAAGNDDIAQNLLESALELSPEFDLVHADLARALLAER